ncbi:hypothetical protein BGX29_011557 [Mortierella sp. GBA35]|nr:hypothetical protein BGX29_011557 [Mortierella sp. GBA35]
MLPNSIDARQRIIHSCPDSTAWTLFPSDVTPALLQELVDLPNVITSLKLRIPELPGNVGLCPLGRTDDDERALRLLRRYLCESPHLEHLKTINGAIHLEDLDIWGRIGYGTLLPDVLNSTTTLTISASTTPSLSTRKPTWACRNLRTLQIEVHGHSVGVWHVYSRIIFGYIAAVCPRLEVLDLQSGCGRGLVPVRVWGYDHLHCFRLFGGLCLLSGLKQLRRLTINGRYCGMRPNCYDFSSTGSPHLGEGL